MAGFAGALPHSASIRPTCEHMLLQFTDREINDEDRSHTVVDCGVVVITKSHLLEVSGGRWIVRSFVLDDIIDVSLVPPRDGFAGWLQIGICLALCAVASCIVCARYTSQMNWLPHFPPLVVVLAVTGAVTISLLLLCDTVRMRTSSTLNITTRQGKRTIRLERGKDYSACMSFLQSRLNQELRGVRE